MSGKSLNQSATVGIGRAGVKWGSTASSYTEGKVSSTLAICFKCSRIEWDGRSGSTPQQLLRVLRRFIVETGLQPDRDWGTLARKALRLPS